MGVDLICRPQKHVTQQKNIKDNKKTMKVMHYNTYQMTKKLIRQN